MPLEIVVETKKADEGKFNAVVRTVLDDIKQYK